MQADGRRRAEGGLVRTRPPSPPLAPELQWIILGGTPVLPQREGRGPARNEHVLACLPAPPFHGSRSPPQTEQRLPF